MFVPGPSCSKAASPDCEHVSSTVHAGRWRGLAEPSPGHVLPANIAFCVSRPHKQCSSYARLWGLEEALDGAARLLRTDVTGGGLRITAVAAHPGRSGAEALELLQQGLELVLGGAHEFVDLLAVNPDLEGGHGGDAALAGDVLDGVHVDLEEDYAGVLLGLLVEVRPDHAARPAPHRAEVDHHRLLLMLALLQVLRPLPLVRHRVHPLGLGDRHRGAPRAAPARTHTPLRLPPALTPARGCWEGGGAGDGGREGWWVRARGGCARWGNPGGGRGRSGKVEASSGEEGEFRRTGLEGEIPRKNARRDVGLGLSNSLASLAILSSFYLEVFW